MTTETLTLLTDVSPAFWYPRVYPWMAGIIKDHPGYDEQSVYRLLAGQHDEAACLEE